MGVVALIVFGLIAGALAQAIFPGGQAAGLASTLALGLAGALIGGLIASALGLGGVAGFNIQTLLVAVGGAALAIGVYEALAGPSRSPRS